MNDASARTSGGADARGEPLRADLDAVARLHGFGGAFYMHLGHAPGAPAPLRLAATSAFDVDQYLQSGFFIDDPLSARARAGFAPFDWSLDALRRDAPAAHGLLDALSGWSVRCGVVAPVQDYAAGPALLCLFEPRARGGETRIECAMVMRAAAHIHAMALACDTGDPASLAVRLSVREMEVLRLAATGLTENDSAQALSLSRRGVQFHLARAMDKLDAPNKTSAVARAVSLGLIRV